MGVFYNKPQNHRNKYIYTLLRNKSSRMTKLIYLEADCTKTVKLSQAP